MGLFVLSIYIWRIITQNLAKAYIWKAIADWHSFNWIFCGNICAYQISLTAKNIMKTSFRIDRLNIKMF